MVVLIGLDPDGEDFTWTAAQGLRTGDSVDLLFILTEEGLRLSLQFGGSLNATATITECVPDPGGVCEDPVGTVFDLVKIF